MPDYQQGKIYTIRKRTDDTLIYVGSTCDKLARRLAKHKYDFKNNKATVSLYSHITDLNDFTDNWYIELYELCPFNSRMELEKREGEVIRQIGTINKNITGRNNKQYRLDNVEKIKEINKKYYSQNTEKIQERMKQYRLDNADKIKEQTKQYRVDNVEKLKQYCLDNAEKLKEKDKKYYLNNTEKVKEKTRQYCIKNAEKVKEKKKQYCLENADKIKEYNKQYRLKKKAEKETNVLVE